MAAKNNASEKALRDIIIHRMLQSPKSHQLKLIAEAGQPGSEQGELSSVDYLRRAFTAVKLRTKHNLGIIGSLPYKVW